MRDELEAVLRPDYVSDIVMLDDRVWAEYYEDNLKVTLDNIQEIVYKTLISDVFVDELFQKYIQTLEIEYKEEELHKKAMRSALISGLVAVDAKP